MIADKKVSVITVCKNSEKTIEKTIHSVPEQTYQNIEYIIIDGKSSDKTWDIIQKYSDRIAFCCSEPDKGIYDAMNKGIQHCSGEIIAFLNSDDWYIPDTVNKVVNCFWKGQSDIVYGDYVFWCSENEQYYVKCNKNIEELNYDVILLHPATFVKKKIFEQLGGFDLKYRIAADYDWLLRAYHNDAKYEYLPEKLCYFRNGGLCTRERIEAAKETKVIAEKYCENKSWNKKINENYKKTVEEAKWDTFIMGIIDGNNELAFIKILEEVGMKKRDVYLFGSGKYGIQSARWCKTLGIKVDGFIDNAPSKWGTTIEGILVEKLETYENRNAQILICSFQYEQEIKEQLVEFGLCEGKDFISLGEIKSRCKY